MSGDPTDTDPKNPIGDLFGPTLPIEDETAGAASSRVPCLTVLYHPDVSRAGWHAPLHELRAGEVVEVSRVRPAFFDAAGEDVGPVADPFVSRRGIRLSMESAQVKLTAEPGLAAAVDGAAIDGDIELSTGDLERGVVIELGGRVVLVLHWMTTGRGRGSDLGMIGATDAIEEVRQRVLDIADLDTPVLIRGETGTGKELVARAIHDASPRASRPFVAVNMSAIPASTAASELFGHAKGAFSGATHDYPGYFGAAEGGTLFLDEIGETPSEIQPMLLRVLETGEIQPVGVASERVTDLRVLAATDIDLEAAASAGRFRAPLLHRLASSEIVLPRLGERRADIGRLLAYFLLIESEERGDPARLVEQATLPRLWFPARLATRMAMHDWPGNVRQLRNVVRHVVVANRRRTEVAVDTTLERLLAREGDTAAPPSPSARPVSPDPSSNPVVEGATEAATDSAPADFRAQVHSYEARLIVEALKASKWNKPEAARRLNMPYRTLAHKVRALGIKDSPDDQED